LSNDSEFNIDILYQYFCDVNNIDATKDNLKKIKNQIVLLSSNNFDQELKKLKERLGNGERIFIISTYQTLGAGVNLQYTIPEGYQPIKINQFDERSEMDISGVYLEKPTNLLIPLKYGKIKDNDFNITEYYIVGGTSLPLIIEKKIKEIIKNEENQNIIDNLINENNELKKVINQNIIDNLINENNELKKVINKNKDIEGKFLLKLKELEEIIVNKSKELEDKIKLIETRW
jgi:hypothetical protein